MRILATLFLFFPVFGLQGQSDFQWTLPFRLEVGLNFAEFDDDSLDTWSQGVGSAISLGAGLGFRYKERFSASLEGGLLLDNYSYWISSDSVQYFLTHLVWESRMHLHYLFPIKSEPGLSIHAGSDLGWTFYSSDTEFEIEPQFLAESESFGPASFMICPEVGVSKRLPIGEMNLLLFYAYHFRNNPSLRTRLYTPAGGDAFSEAKGDYGGFKIRFALDVNLEREPRDLFVEVPLETRVMELRNEQLIDRFEVGGRYVTLKLWDNSELDGDTVSVMVDGAYILHRHCLTKKKKKLRIPVLPGEHRIVVLAHNEGSVPPNTASCQFRAGLFRKSLTISTSMKRNGLIEVVR